MDEAQKHLDQLSTQMPRVFGHSTVQAVAVDLAARRDEEEERQKRFAEAMDAAEAAGAEQPDRIAIDRGAELPLLDAEKIRVLKLQTAVAAIDRRRQTERDEEFIERLKAVRQSIDQLDRSNPDPAKLSSARRELVALMTGSEVVSPTVLSQARTDQTRLETLQEVIRRRDIAQGAVRTIDTRVSVSN